MWLRRPILALAALCLLGLFSTEIADTDFWWHRKTGQYIVEHRALPVPDPFAYTTDLGKPAFAGEERLRYFNLTHEWLAQALCYLIYRVGGFPAVVLFKALLLAAFCGIAGWVAARRTGSIYWGLAAAGGAASIATLFSADRPALVTFLLVAVFIAVLERGGPLWLLPILSLVWANSHGGYFLGWSVVGIYFVAALAGRRPEWRRLGVVLVACVAVSGLNPSYFRIFEILASYRQSQLQQSLVEWSRPRLWGPPYVFDVLLYAGAAVLLVAWRRVKLADALLFAAFAGAALLAFRNIVFVGFLAPVMIATYFPWRRSLPGVAPVAVAAALAVALAAGVATGRFFQLRAGTWKFPAGAAEWILAHNATSPIFNTYEQGGFLIGKLWPQRKVFIDGRALNESVYQDYVRVLGNAGGAHARDAVLERYGARAIVMNAFESTSGVLYPVVLALAEPGETRWQLVYQDPQALVFLRDPPPDATALAKTQIRDHLEAECRLYLDHDPELCLCARTLGFLFARNGDAARARRWLDLYLRSPHESDPEADAAYRRLGGR